MIAIAQHPTKFYFALARLMTSMEVVYEVEGENVFETERKFKLVMDQGDIRLTGNGPDAFQLLCDALKEGMFHSENEAHIRDTIDKLVVTVKVDYETNNDEPQDLEYELVIDGALFTLRAETGRNIFGFKHTFG